MGDTESSATGDRTGEGQNSDISTLLNFLRQQVPQTPQPTNQNQNKHYQPVTIGVKLDEFNFSVWSRMMRMAIGGRGCLKHITGNPEPPPEDAAEYPIWEQEDLNVQSDIVHNIGADLVPIFIEYPTAKELWDGLTATYSSGRDYLQIFDLKNQANTQKQEDRTIEAYYGCLQRLWREIDRRESNPMTCSIDIATFNRLKQEERLFQFLTGINNQFDGDRKEILRTSPLPTVETAYATIRRETSRRAIMGGTTMEGRIGETHPEVGSGLAASGRSERGKPSSSFLSDGPGKTRSEKAKAVAFSSHREEEIDKSKLRCTHCGGTRHTREGCFKLNGYPEWWPGKKGQQRKPGASAVAVGG